MPPWLDPGRIIELVVLLVSVAVGVGVWRTKEKHAKEWRCRMERKVDGIKVQNDANYRWMVDTAKTAEEALRQAKAIGLEKDKLEDRVGAVEVGMGQIKGELLAELRHLTAAVEAKA